MKAVLQRVLGARVEIDNKVYSKIDKSHQGLLILLGVHKDDTEKEAEYLAQKIAVLRIFNDQEGKMNLSVKDVAGQIIVVSQFTLYASWQKGRRPGFTQALSPQRSDQLYEYFVSQLRSQDLSVQTGQFGADMMVRINNNGPVTLILDTRNPE